MPTFLAAMSPLTLIVLLVFLFGVALVVALWSLLTLGSSPRAVAVARAPRVTVKKVAPKPLPSNRFMKQRLEADLKDEDVLSELPTDHVSRSRVRILKTLEPDPELETPALKPTTYDQMVNRQRVPKTGLTKANLPKTGLPTDTRRMDLPKTTTLNPSLETKNVVPAPSVVQPAINLPPKKITPPLRSDADDTSTQPSLFETGRNKHIVPSSDTREMPASQPRDYQPSLQREESEAAFRASQSLETPAKPRTQEEKDKAFENFLRKNDDLGF